MPPCPRCGAARTANHRFCAACGFPFPDETPATPSDPLVGTVLPGDYVLLELVGVGGMGRVYRAEQRALGRTVAVKVIHPHLLGDEASATRFTIEARAASRLNHPNSLAVIDFGRHGSLPYLVTEFLRGRDLARVMKEDGLLSLRRVIAVMTQVLAALEEAHHAGIVHRDLKAENIVLETLRTGEDFVKVVDFGLAKLADPSRPEARSHSHGVIAGSPEYMSPEQARGEPVDARSDLYSCGVVLFLLLTGKLPFESDTPLTTLMMQLTQPPPDPLAVAPQRGIPRALGDIVLRAMAKHPAERFPDATEMARALRGGLPSPSLVPPAPTSSQPCGSCGELVPGNQRFCGECGAPQGIEDEITEDEPIVHSLRGGLPSLPLPFTMRDDTIAELDLRVLGLGSMPDYVRIVGEPGVGKSALLRELGSSWDGRGNVVYAGPDPWLADVGYWALRTVVSALAGIPFRPAAAVWPGADEAARSGLLEIFEIPGAPKVDAATRRAHAAAALRWAIGVAQTRADLPIIVIVDDFEQVDGASRNAFEDVLLEPFDRGFLLVAAHAPRFEARGGTALVLGGLPTRIAAELLKGVQPTPGGKRSPGPGRVFPPYYVDQLVRFTQEGGTDPPDKLADLVARRVDRLPLAARLMLQTLAVTGQFVSVTELANVVGASGMESAVDILAKAGMAAVAREEVRLTHPLLAEVALASTPAEVRRELHARALAAQPYLPLEVRAMHAHFGQAGLEALMLLEAVAARCASRADGDGQIRALYRALEVARREMLGDDSDDAMGAAVLVGRKLGDALVRVARYTEAEGIFREALHLADPTSPSRDAIAASLKMVHERRRSGS